MWLRARGRVSSIMLLQETPPDILDKYAALAGVGQANTNVLSKSAVRVRNAVLGCVAVSNDVQPWCVWAGVWSSRAQLAESCARKPCLMTQLREGCQISSSNGRSSVTAACCRGANRCVRVRMQGQACQGPLAVPARAHAAEEGAAAGKRHPRAGDHPGCVQSHETACVCLADDLELDHSLHFRSAGATYSASHPEQRRTACCVSFESDANLRHTSGFVSPTAACRSDSLEETVPAPCMCDTRYLLMVVHI